MFAKYCMFIDGVDEFNGDHFEMCHILKELSMCPNFKICLSSRPLNAKEPLDLQLYQAYEYEDEDKDYALNKSIESSSKLDATLDQCRRRLNARCGGLLEIKEQRVEFLHLTVRDFLLTREMSDYLSSKSGHDFSVNLSTLKAFIFLFRSWVRSKDSMSLAEDEIFWREGIKYANDALEESKEAALMHLDAVEDLYLDMSGSEDYGILDFQSGCVFQSQLLSFGVDRYVYFKLKENSHFFDGVLELPLYEISDRHHWSQGHINIIVSLLKSSHDPNIGDRDSPWGQFLQRACGKTEAHNFRKAIVNGLFSVFLKHGAKRVLPVSSNSEAGIDEVATVTNNVISPKLPCTQFIVALFDHEFSHRLNNQCLGALYDFLDGSPEEITLPLNEILGLIQVEFKKAMTQVTEPGRLRFFAQITQKLIRKGIQVGVNMDMLIADLEALFPKRLGSTLVDMIRKKEDSEFYYSDSSPLKRRQSGTELTSKIVTSGRR